MQLRWGEILCMQASVLSWNSWDFNSCPEIFSMSWIFCRCPEIFEHTCRWYTCKSLTDYMARRAEVNKLSYFWECCIYISFREWTPLPMWASDPTVDPENWRTYSILVLWHCWRYKTNSALVLLVSSNYCIFRWLQWHFFSVFVWFCVLKNVLKF